MVADLLGLVGQVVGVDADAVPTDEAGAEGQEVPFGAGGFQDLAGVDVELVEEDGEFVDEGDVDVALGVLDDLGGFGDADAGGAVGSRGDDAGVEVVDEFCGFGGGAAGDLLDVGQAVGVVAGVDAFGGVADGEVGIEGQAGSGFEDGDADFFGAARVDGGFVDDGVAGFEGLADDGRGCFERGEVGLFGVIDGVGTVTMQTDAAARSVGSEVSRRQVASASSASGTSRVESWAAASSEIRGGLVSKPITW